MKAPVIGMSAFASLLLFLLPIPGLTQFLDGECGIQIENSSSSPWIAFLHTTDLVFVCVGTLITNKLVLTAAHCIMSNAQLTARLGEFTGSREENNTFPVEHQVKKLFRHSFYDMDTYANDIAILELATYVVYTENIRPICILWDPTWKQYIDSIQVLSGPVWGKAQDEDESNGLRMLHIRRQPPEMCTTMLGTTLNNQFCAGNSESNLCNIDCSSPLGAMIPYKNTHRFIQIGIATTNQRCNNPSVYTDVLFHIDFILRVWRYYDNGQGEQSQIK
ncbi:proclotting enzyme-like [Drosophila rhopaloa]|uniref:Peptidase S1 domain-containing protein n=1 Tax=Drosophila rhopaloa TaxID=1041015 RepID=A0ABM5HKC0_DRORH|nr:proclotting enzyme-like [Drosophila rhopaloa]